SGADESVPVDWPSPSGPAAPVGGRLATVLDVPAWSLLGVATGLGAWWLVLSRRRWRGGVLGPRGARPAAWPGPGVPTPRRYRLPRWCRCRAGSTRWCAPVASSFPVYRPGSYRRPRTRRPVDRRRKATQYRRSHPPTRPRWRTLRSGLAVPLP